MDVVTHMWSHMVEIILDVFEVKEYRMCSKSDLTKFPVFMYCIYLKKGFAYTTTFVEKKILDCFYI